MRVMFKWTLGSKGLRHIANIDAETILWISSISSIISFSKAAEVLYMFQKNIYFRRKSRFPFNIQLGILIIRKF